jgi:hypothetical protein
MGFADRMGSVRVAQDGPQAQLDKRALNVRMDFSRRPQVNVKCANWDVPRALMTLELALRA